MGSPKLDISLNNEIVTFYATLPLGDEYREITFTRMAQDIEDGVVKGPTNPTNRFANDLVYTVRFRDDAVIFERVEITEAHVSGRFQCSTSIGFGNVEAKFTITELRRAQKVTKFWGKAVVAFKEGFRELPIRKSFRSLINSDFLNRDYVAEQIEEKLENIDNLQRDIIELAKSKT